SFGQFAKSLTPEGHLKLEFQGNPIVLNNIGLNDLKDYHLQFNRRVSDGYISGATVFVDANGNGELDGGESSTTTDATGAFTLAGSGQLVAFGGTDISTGLPFAGKLLAPSGSIVITPLTTLLVNGVNESDLLAAFDLPSGFDIRLGDPIAGLLAGHAGSAAVFAAGAKVIDTVIAMATALAGLGGDEADALNEAFAVIAEAINNLDPGQTLDLTDPAIVAKLFDNLAQLQGIDPGALTGAVATAIASSNATIDQHLETDGATDDLLTNVSDTQGQLQSNQSPAAIDDSAVVVKGKILQGNVLANDTDPDGDTVQLVGVSGGTIGASLAGKFGRIVFEADGDFTYVANKSGLPTRPVPQDTFEYIVTDGNAGAGTALLSVLIVGKNHKFQAGANTTLTGGESKDVLDGSLGNAVLIGEKSSDVLIGGAGNSHTGGKGKDIFLFRPDFGENTITDFDIKGDLIQIHASVFTTVADILAHTTDTLAGAVIDDGAGNRITLAGVFFDQLRENDFVIG
ncbi:MAG: Ig-like domain-containing protein, partial [Pseudorhodoplanes sp.]